jgi:hypothetical protein
MVEYFDNKLQQAGNYLGNTTEIIETYKMFAQDKGWYKKISADISNWDINKVDNMSKMFNGCSLIKSFSFLSNWDLSKAKTEDMFGGCENAIIPK